MKTCIKPRLRTCSGQSGTTTDPGKNVPGDGTTFFGSKGWVTLSREGAEASNPESLNSQMTHEIRGDWAQS